MDGAGSFDCRFLLDLVVVFFITFLPIVAFVVEGAVPGCMI
jgi:hypothetical protein